MMSRGRHVSHRQARNTQLFVGGYFSLAFAMSQISGEFWPPDAIKCLGGPAELSQTRPVIYALLCIAVAAAVAVFGLSPPS
jgi:hypothetical protein